jgi:hypothetical protein
VLSAPPGPNYIQQPVPESNRPGQYYLLEPTKDNVSPKRQSFQRGVLMTEQANRLVLCDLETAKGDAEDLHFSDAADIQPFVLLLF